MAVAEYIGDGSPDGTCVFQSGEKGGFYGLATPIVQPTGATMITTAGTDTTSTSTRRSLNQVIEILNSLGICSTISGYGAIE